MWATETRRFHSLHRQGELIHAAVFHSVSRVDRDSCGVGSGCLSISWVVAALDSVSQCASADTFRNGHGHLVRAQVASDYSVFSASATALLLALNEGRARVSGRSG